MSADDLIIRSGHVVRMDPGLGDIPGGDVLVSGGRITTVGPGLDAPGARELDGREMIVAPGLVDTHWHMWNTLLRSMSGGMPGEDRPSGYFSVSLGLGQAFTAGDNYQGTLLACAEAINSGITTVHEWSHNVRGRAHAEAELRALAEAALRALREDWKAAPDGAPLILGMACRGLGGSNLSLRVPSWVYRQEIGAARGLGLPVTVHASGPPAAVGLLAAGIRAGLSVDTTALTGNADMFAIMKLTQGLINGTAQQEFACTARQALALGTLGEPGPSAWMR